jgi:uncharacterized membrane protein
MEYGHRWIRFRRLLHSRGDPMRQRSGRYSDQIVAYYSNQANRLAQIEGFVTLTIRLVLFAIFVAGLRAVATRSEPWSSLIFGTGLATVLCLVIANTL